MPDYRQDDPGIMVWLLVATRVPDTPLLGLIFATEEHALHALEAEAPEDRWKYAVRPFFLAHAKEILHATP